MNRELLATFSLALCVLLIFAGCSSSINNNDSSADVITKIDRDTAVVVEDTIRNNSISFHCALGDTSEFGDNFMIGLTCTVKNNSENDVNYICQSCNGLEYYILAKPDSYKVMPFLHCNVTWGMIGQLKSGDSIEFKTQLLMFKNSDPIEKIGLDLRLVDQYISFDTLREHPEMIENVYRAEIDEKNIIWDTEINR